ncbi:putative protein [Vanrija pseudolonga]|uniref:Purtative protein n=1 Tax=Vanrija pseudolonga TaxID=143232 RepID=A0AAF0YEQ6_9TREE|nr:purtative protein [Vanrija pseudolonga]
MPRPAATANSQRSRNQEVSTENEAIIVRGGYTHPVAGRVDLASAVKAACDGVVSYDPTATARLLRDAAQAARPFKTLIEVTPETSTEAHERLALQENAPSIAVLNFASARNPGGGYLGGARAQEEDICRHSALYTTLTTPAAADYYACHNKSSDRRYSHRVIWSPDVPVYRDCTGALLAAPYAVSFLTSPAPNAGAVRRDPAMFATVPGLLRERAARVLAVAAAHGVRTLVLGAWGCGVFQNRPEDTARAFADLVNIGGDFYGVFERIVFAVYDNSKSQETLTAFRVEFGVGSKNYSSRAEDQATIDATVTGSRLDDETAGLTGQAGTLHRARKCYVCKARYKSVHFFYYALCPECAELNYAKRNPVTDLRGRRALVTGGRAKIGMYVVLWLLRNGAHVTLTTRFPADAVRRFATFDDATGWTDRLEIVGIDLRDPRQVLRLAERVAAAGLDILINNAAQTIRRSAEAYAPLLRAEAEGLPAGENQPKVHILERFSAPVPCGTRALPLPQAAEHLTVADVAVRAESTASSALATIADRNISQALTPNSNPSNTARIDAGGLLPDLGHTNTWSNTVGSIPALEILEVSLCNATAPMLLINALRPALAASPHARTYIVNVSAAEGQFAHYKTPGHAHTNMQKAGLNMITRTAADEMFATDGILMTSVDTGWVTDERPWDAKLEAWGQGFRCPLDLVDGAARIYDPIVRGEEGEDVYGVLLKDYRVVEW